VTKSPNPVTLSGSDRELESPKNGRSSHAVISGREKIEEFSVTRLDPNFAVLGNFFRHNYASMASCT
jgi:hypothetical protein